MEKAYLLLHLNKGQMILALGDLCTLGWTYLQAGAGKKQPDKNQNGIR